jgi:hypothetical protein
VLKNSSNDSPDVEDIILNTNAMAFTPSVSADPVNTGLYQGNPANLRTQKQ